MRTIRPDADFVAGRMNPDVFRPQGAILYYEDYIVMTNAQGGLIDVLEQDHDRLIMVPGRIVLLREPATTHLWSIGTPR